MKAPIKDTPIHWHKWVVCGVLLIVTAVLYWPVGTYDFVDYDDLAFVVRNSHINHGFHWSQAGWFFQAGFGANWYPLTWMSHALDFQLYGHWAGGHHLTNVILHTLSATALFLLLQRFTKAFWRSAFVAALFAWHPLHVQSVAWISERKDCLSCLLWVLTLWAYLRYAVNLKTQNSNFKLYYWLAVILFAFGLMAKPMVVTLPFVLLLLDFWPLGRVNARTVRALVIEKIPFFLLSAAGCVVTVVAQSRVGAVQSLQVIPLAFRFWNAAISYLWYVEKALWPGGLMIIYPLEERSTWLIGAACAFIILITGLALFWRQRRPYFLFGWFWYLGTLVPVLGLVQVGFQATADRFFYIPSIGLFIIVAWGACDLAARWPFHRVILGALAGGVLVASMVATRIQLSCWRDSESLYTRTLQVMPDNFLVLGFHASYLRDQGKLEEARTECEKSLRVFPNYGVARNILAEVLLAEKKLDQAAEEFRLTLQSLPNKESAHINLGNILLAENLPGEAAVEFQTALHLDPNNEQIHSGLAKALAGQGKMEEAKGEFAQCIRLNPDDAEPHSMLGALLSGQGKSAEAIAQFQLAVRLQPNSAEALNNLAWALAANSHADLRDGKEAVRLATRACALTHNSMPLVIGTLAAAYAEAGQFDEAVAAAQKAHDLALALGMKAIAAKNLELLALYRSHHPFHENP